jgi:hypothetical protein
VCDGNGDDEEADDEQQPLALLDAKRTEAGVFVVAVVSFGWDVREP